jgi:HSP20 family protein
VSAPSIEKKDTILDEVERVSDQITKRAYESFEGWGRKAGVVRTPPIKVIEVEASDRRIKVKIATPGIDAKNLHVEVAPQRLVVEAESEDEEKDEAGGRTVKRVKLFRALSFAREIDPDSAKAELRDGVLTLTAKVADAKHRAAKEVVVAHGEDRREDRRGRRRRDGIDGNIRYRTSQDRNSVRRELQ